MERLGEALDALSNPSETFISNASGRLAWAL
jgi:hypothetical protein